MADFLKVVSKRNLTLNESNSVLSSSTIIVLGYLIGNGVVRPGQERLRPLQELPLPTNVRSQRRVLGLFAYYAKWISIFSKKNEPLLKELAAFPPIDEGILFVVECDTYNIIGNSKSRCLISCFHVQNPTRQ